MKKILAIAPYTYLPYFSGGQKFIALFFEWLGKETELTVVSVINNDFSMAGTYQGLGWLSKSRARYMDRSLVRKISALIKDKGFDALIIEHPYYAWLAFALRKLTGIKVIIHTHNIEYQRFRSAHRWWWPVLRGYEKRSFRKADALLFISPDDKEFVISEWKIPEQKCVDVPYGIEVNSPPTDKAESRNFLQSKFGIGEDERIFLFAGLLNYKPNEEATRVIVKQLYPRLTQTLGKKFRILISGKNLAEAISQDISATGNTIIYTGFVEDIATYFKGADIFLNPVMSGGGVKTKIIEAIAAGTTVVSTQTGAVGMELKVCGNKLITVRDNDWDGFANTISDPKEFDQPTASEFYNYYFYGNIIERLKDII